MVSLADLLPAGLTATAVNGTVTQGSYDPATGIFTIGSLASGATATLTLEGTVDVGEGGNTITNVTTAATLAIKLIRRPLEMIWKKQSSSMTRQI